MQIIYWINLIKNFLHLIATGASGSAWSIDFPRCYYPQWSKLCSVCLQESTIKTIYLSWVVALFNSSFCTRIILSLLAWHFNSVCGKLSINPKMSLVYTHGLIMLLLIWISKQHIESNLKSFSQSYSITSHVSFIMS